MTTTVAVDPETAVELEALRACPEALDAARVVGRWVWVEFAAKPAEATREFLKARGYRWNRTRSCWQHACGYRTRQAKGYDPRTKYGAIRAAQFITTPEEG